MRNRMLVALVIAATVAGMSGAAFARVDFTGGTAYMLGGGTYVPNGTMYVAGVDYYVEDGFKMDFIGDGGIIGTYYGSDNDVIHAHWASSDHGNVTSIVVTKEDNTAFDLNYFVLTSNTANGGGADTGNEQAWITASNGYSQMLPTDDWGWAGSNPQIYLGSEFDGITSFTFTVTNYVYCFGMDNFYIDEDAPVVPAPGAIVLAGIGMSIVGWMRRKRAL